MKRTRRYKKRMSEENSTAKMQMPPEVRARFVAWGRKGGRNVKPETHSRAGKASALKRYALTPRCPACLKPLKKHEELRPGFKPTTMAAAQYMDAPSKAVAKALKEQQA